jgi:hypothetical protein
VRKRIDGNIKLDVVALTTFPGPDAADRDGVEELIKITKNIERPSEAGRRALIAAEQARRPGRPASLLEG